MKLLNFTNNYLNMGSIAMIEHDGILSYQQKHEAIEWLSSLKDINDATSYILSITDDTILFMGDREAYFATIILNEIILKVTEGDIHYSYDNDFDLFTKLYRVQKILSDETLVYFEWDEEDYIHNDDLKKTYHRMILLNLT